MQSVGFLREDDAQPDYKAHHDKIAPLAHMDENGRREYWATLALRHCRGLGARRRAVLLKYFGSARASLENVDSWSRLGLPDRLREEINHGAWHKSAHIEWDRAAELDAGILLWPNPLYPKLLREIPDSPSLLYCQGDAALLAAPAIAVVGSRKASAHGRELAAIFGNVLSACGITVISGMAGGIDSAAHTGAIKAVGKSIGILGTGIDIHYPHANRKLFQQMAACGLLLSEFSPGMAPIAANFPIRNRIISGISLGVVVVEAAIRSGSLITARLALEQNREVFAIPGAAMDAASLGCQNLIRQGAVPAFCVDDILQHLKEQLTPWKIKPPVPESHVQTNATIPSRARKTSNAQAFAQPPDIPEAANPEPPFANAAAQKLVSRDNSARVLACLEKHGPTHVDMLANLLEIGAAELNPLLVGLEMFGKIKRLPGARFEANGK